MSEENVMVIVLDSLRKDSISPYDDSIDYTGNLDEISKDSEVFSKVVAQGPWTLPSHASMFTGQYPWEHEATQKKIVLETDKKLLAQRFKDQGYKTALITPNGWLTPSKGTTKGFQEVKNFMGVAEGPVQKIVKSLSKVFDKLKPSRREKIASYFNELAETFSDFKKSRPTVDETKAFLNNVDPDENFFVFVNLMTPHEPYTPGDPPQEYLDKHGVKDISKVPETEEDYLKEETDEEEIKKAYKAGVDYTDDLVGEIYDCFKENGLDENTNLVILSDHGQALGEEGIFSHQFTVTDSVINTALMIKEPGKENTVKDSGLMELKDLYEIIPKLAGLKHSEIKDRDIAKGGYEYPEFFMGWIPEDMKENLNRKYRFMKKGNKKIVKSLSRNGDTSYKMINTETGEQLEIDEEMKKQVDNIENTSEVQTDVEDEEVKKRLEDLGYM